MTPLPVTTTPTAYRVSCVPETVSEHYHWAITVDYCGRNRWAVRWSGASLSTDGTWDTEPHRSARDDAWRATHQYDLNTALTLAHQQAPTLEVRGLLPTDALARDHARRT